MLKSRGFSVAKKMWKIVPKSKFFIGVSVTTKGVYGNTVPYPTKGMVEEKISEYFPEDLVIEKYNDEALNELVDQAAEIIYQRWIGKDYLFQNEPPLDYSEYSSKQIQVLKTCATVPYGTTLSYGELASKSGYVGAARFAGTCMAKTRFPILIPCHRITRASSLGKYGDDPNMKQMLLEREGIDVINLFRKKRKIKTPI
jgi:methylated-DNA-[protein]-cysteine S-methyltransferase